MHAALAAHDGPAFHQAVFERIVIGLLRADRPAQDAWLSTGSHGDIAVLRACLVQIGASGAP